MDASGAKAMCCVEESPAFSSQVLRDNIAHVENPVAAVVVRTDGIGLDGHGSTV
jgi:hypothetical protein